MTALQKISFNFIACTALAVSIATIATPASAANQRSRAYMSQFNSGFGEAETVDVFADSYIDGLPPSLSLGQITCGINTLVRRHPNGTNYSLIPEFRQVLSTTCR